MLNLLMSGGGGSPPIGRMRPSEAARLACCAKTAGSTIGLCHGAGSTTGLGNGPGSTTGVGQCGRVQPPPQGHGAGSTTGEGLGINCHWPAHGDGAGSLTKPPGGNPPPPVPVLGRWVNAASIRVSRSSSIFILSSAMLGSPLVDIFLVGRENSRQQSMGDLRQIKA